MTKQVYVEQLSEGDPVDSQFVITSSNVYPYSKGHRLALRLADRTGKVDGILWDCPEDAAQRFPSGSVVAIEGTVGSYKGALQVVVGSITGCAPDTVDPTDFLPSSRRDPDEMERELRELVATIGHEGLRAVCEAFLDGKTFEKFRAAPGGKRWHHGYVHGLLEHVLSVMGLCARLCDHYPEADRSVVLTAALLHDLGKVRELAADLSIDYTTAGRLLGHQVMSIPMVSKMLSAAEGVSPDTALEVMHTIAAHHGEQEGSLVRPMTREAVLLHFADHIDATMNAWGREIDRARQAGRPWTDYVKLIDRFLYAGPAAEPRPAPADESEFDEE